MQLTPIIPALISPASELSKYVRATPGHHVGDLAARFPGQHVGDLAARFPGDLAARFPGDQNNSRMKHYRIVTTDRVRNGGGCVCILL